MRLARRDFLQLAAAAAAGPITARVAQAQAYPSRPITVIVPTGAGGPQDAIARILIEGMRPSLGQPVIVENVPGAGGTLAPAGSLAQSPTDIRSRLASHSLR